MASSVGIICTTARSWTTVGHRRSFISTLLASALLSATFSVGASQQTSTTAKHESGTSIARIQVDPSVVVN